MKKGSLYSLAGYLLAHKAKIIVVLLSLSITALSTIFIGHIFKSLIDYGLKEHNQNHINYYMILLVGLIFVFASASFLRSYFINLVAENVTSKIKLDSYASLMRRDVQLFETLKVGDIISSLSLDIDNIGKLITNFLSFLIRNIVMLSGGIFMMFTQSSKLSILVIVILPILLVPLLSLSKKVRALSRNVNSKQGIISSIIEESFFGIRDVVSYNKQQYMTNNFASYLIDYTKVAAERFRLRSMFFALAITGLAVSISIVIWIGSLDILNGSITSGQMISFMYYAILVGFSAGGIAEIFSEISSPIASLERVMELSNGFKYENKLHNHDKEIGSLEDIVFNKVKFSYPARPEVEILKDLSFRIKYGQFAAIVGQSGSGKSTILQLLVKFYAGYDGEILLGKEKLVFLDAGSIRNKIAYVPQDPTIFSGTIMSNIVFSNPHSTELEIDHVIETIGIKDFVSKFPQGLNTEIGEKGVRLSGGQKQRIAIARALLYKPEILILDEATSALDRESEQKIISKIRKIMNGKTIISIAHRMSAIKDADQIIVLHHGKVAARGIHKELLDKSDIYKLLYQENKYLT